MEEDKKIKRKKVFKMIYKIISYTIICILMTIAAFLIFYVISGKIAQKQGKKPLFGLYTIIRLSGSKKNRNLAPFHDMGLMRFLTSD